MGSTPTRRAVPRVRALLFSVVTTIALILGTTSAAPAAGTSGDIEVYVTFEGYNLGQGYYVEPLKVTVPAGQSAAQATMAVLAEGAHALSPDPGDPTSTGWYLDGVAGFDKGTVTPPSYIASRLGFELTGNNGDAFLGATDYNPASGWMYTVDNVAGQVGAGRYPLQDGDVLRWQFTLYGTGCDIGLGCSGEAPYYTMVDKSALVRAIVDADSTTATEAELTTARAVAVNPTATGPQVTSAIAALVEPAEPAARTWTTLVTSAQGQVLTKLRGALVAEFGQSADAYDYSVIKNLRITGPVGSADFTTLRNTAYAASTVEHLDLSGAVTTSMYALNGLPALTDVLLPSVTSVTSANLFQGDVALKNVSVSAGTATFGSATAFNGATSLERITFARASAPTLNASTFNGSNNATAGSRVVIASVPDKTAGGYQGSTFTQFFASVVDTSPNPPATDELVAALNSTIDRARDIPRISDYSDAKWTALAEAITAAETVAANDAATSGAVNDARDAVTKAIDGLLGLSFKVSRGAEIGLYQKGTAHFAAFAQLPLKKVTELSDTTYDVYVPTTTLANGTYNASAVIHGQTDKVVRVFSVAAATADAVYTLDLTPLSERTETPLVIGGSGVGDVRNLYTNVDDTGVVNLASGEHFDLDTIRTGQAQPDSTSNYFIEPDYDIVVSGSSITTAPIGSEGRRQTRITATEPGVSVIKIGYGPLRYIAASGSVSDLNAIEKQNTGLVVVNVTAPADGALGTDVSTPAATGIATRNELDTYYFDAAVGSRPFTFTPAPGTTVRVHDPLNVAAWGSGWTTYEPGSDGSVTVALKGGRNVVELTHGGQVQYRVLRAKAITMAIANATDPGAVFEAGDTARLTLKGIEGGIEKLAGIYNPAFNAGTKPQLTYGDASGSITSNEGGQYASVTTTYTLNYTVPEDADTTLTGFVSIGGLGAEWPYHREIPLTGKPANMNAVAIGPYHLGALPPVYVHDGQVSTWPEGVPLDTAALEAALTTAAALVEGDYTEASWANLVSAVEAGTALLGDDDATQAAVGSAAAAITSAVAGLSMKGVAPAVPSVDAKTVEARRAAAAWISGQLDTNGDVLDRAGTPDWGLTIDAVFALAGANVSGRQIHETAEEIYDSGSAYVGNPAQVAFTWPYIAKTVLALQIAGLDPTTFPAGTGTRDLVADLRSAVRPDGTWANATDPFKTSLGILALARTPQGVPAAAVERFEAMACAQPGHDNDGAFGFGTACSSADVDTTSLAVQALLAAGVKADDEAVTSAASWIKDQKPADGFPGQWGTGNTNSSGLAGQALFAAGEISAATSTGTFIQSLQIGCTTLADAQVTETDIAASLKAARGAIAYNTEGWTTAVREGVGPTNVDQWRRATVQAALGLGAESLGFVSAEHAEAEVPTSTCPAPEPEQAAVATRMVASAGRVAGVYGRAGGLSVVVSAIPAGTGTTGSTAQVVPTGTVRATVAGRTVTAALVRGRATVTWAGTAFKPGTSTITLTYAGVAGRFTGSSITVPVVVAKAAATVRVQRPAKVARGKVARFTVTVTAPGAKPGGRVRVTVAGKTKRVKVTSRGTAVVKIRLAKRAATGTKRVVVVYGGDGYVGARTVRMTLRVTR